MPDTDRLKTLSRVLGELLDGRGDTDVEGSVRRIATSIARDRSMAGSLREIAASMLDQSGEILMESADQLRLLLDLELREAAPVLRHAMIVEPEHEVALEVARRLESIGWRVTVMEGADGVVERLQSDRAELILVDVFLPDRDGRDLILDLDQSPVGRDVPIVALAPRSQRDSFTKSECLALGAAHFLYRSEIPNQLVPLVEEILGEGVRGTDVEARSAHGVLRRAQFGVRFATRESSAGGGCLGLVQLQGLRELAERMGPDQADRVALEIATALADEVSAIEAIGRWATLQLVLLIPDAGLETAADELKAAALRLAGRTWSPEAEPVVGELTICVVEAPRGAPLEDRVSVASRLRLGLGREGVLIGANSPRVPDRPPRVAVVEDDPVTQALVVHKLRHAGFEVDAYGDGNRASAAFQNERFDLYLLDINLPGRDGFELIREIRSREEIRNRPILVLSSMGSDSDVVRGLDLGADDYMLKPFSPVEMTARVRRLLGGANG